MKTTVALAAALAVFALPFSANAATKHRTHPRAGYGAYARGGGQIACTQFGCMPVHRGCHREGGRTFSGLPSGFDVEVCPSGTLYGTR